MPYTITELQVIEQAKRIAQLEAALREIIERSDFTIDDGCQHCGQIAAAALETEAKRALPAYKELNRIRTEEVETQSRPCTCHPDDRPPVCMHRYAANECIETYRSKTK